MKEIYPGQVFQNGSVIALGNFDGVHIGHKKLIDEIIYLSKKNGYPSIVYTFREHPHNIIKGEYVTKCITENSEKFDILSEMGVDYIYFEEFERIRNDSPERFVDEVLIGLFGVSHVVCGFNFTFGAGGKGRADTLRELLARRNIRLTVIDPIVCGGILVSSSYIRGLIEGGNMEAASLFLGREFFINFPVIYGRQLGRTLGIPTINQEFPPCHIIPARGVYACSCYLDGEPYICLTNVGCKPTVSDQTRFTSETHILNFEGDLYGKRIRVNFFKKIRDEIKFPSLAVLQSEIQKDIQTTISYFNLNY